MTVCLSLIISAIITVVFENVNCTKTSISECDRYFKNVSGIVGLAFDCFSEYSQPVALCGQCAEIMGKLYDSLNDSQTTTDYGLPCFSFINSSSFQSPIRDILWKVADTWQNAHCSDCLVELGPRLSDSKCRHLDNAETNLRNYQTKFDGSVSSSHPDYKYTAYNNQTLAFFSHLNDTLLCIAPFIHNTSVTILDPVNFPPLDKVSVDATVCTYCNDAYRKLIEPYIDHISMEKGHNEQRLIAPPHTSLYSKDKLLPLCRDVSDALNRTHWVWHHMLNCTPNTTTIRPVVALMPLLICSLLLVLFHCCLLCCCHRPIRLILYKPTRVEAASPNSLAPLHRNEVSNHNFESVDSLNNGGELSRSLSVQFRQRKFDSRSRNFSYDVLQVSHAEENC